MTDPASRRRIEWAAFAAVLLVAAVLRLIRLDDNGFGTAYYAAGVRSMLQGVWLFFYNSFDPAGFISLDKPPIAFWNQTIFAAVLGYSGWSIHLPQALAGIASVALLYRLVRPLGAPAAVIQASRWRPSSVPASSQPASKAGPHTNAASILVLKARPSSAIATTSDRPRPRSTILAASSRKKISHESVLFERSTATATGIRASIRAAQMPAATPNGRRTSR